MKIKKMKSFVALLLAVTLVFSTNIIPASAAKKVKVSSVKVVSPTGSKKVAYVAKGKTIKLSTTVKVKPNKKANKGVTYKSANTKIAKVSKKGVVKGKKAGTTKITVVSKKNPKKKKTIKIKVVKNAVKKVTLDKKSTVVGIGNTTKLKATVKASKKSSYKGIKWTTSNKKVATVTKNGVVKGVKGGTAKITATAVDGSKKKATCKVTVGASIKTVSVVNPLKSRYSDVISVQLDSAKVLTKSGFQVKLKEYSDGNFNKIAEIEDVFTTDNKNYKLYLKNNNVYVGEYVQVTVPSLSGIKTAQTQFKSEAEDLDEVIIGEVGDNIGEYISNSLRGYSVAAIASGTLPSGLTFNAKKSYFGGTVKAVANNNKVTFKVTNELNETQKVNYNFLIGDANHLYVESRTVGEKTGDKIYSHQGVSEYLNIVGGSDSNNVVLTDSCGGKFEISSSSDDGFRIRANSDAKLAAGTYNVKYKVTDSVNTNIAAYGTLKVVVSASVPVTVVLKNTEAAGYPTVYFYNHNLETEYSGYDFNNVSANGVETITANLPKGNYTIYYQSYGVKKVLAKYVGLNAAATLSYNLSAGRDIKVNVLDKNGQALKQRYYVDIYRADELAEDPTSYREARDYGGYYSDGYWDADDNYIEDGYYETVTFGKALPGKYILKVFSDDTDKEIASQTAVTVGNVDVTVNIKTSLVNN